MLSSCQVRQQFIDYFVRRHSHTVVPSSLVVPHNDPTLLFTNAGMNQFKDVFLGTAPRACARAVNSQKCIRAGGKHNDLEDVGKDHYHHTFFEMLGNWSFGDYFKKEAITWAWDLFTNVWNLPKDRLHVTVFGGDQAAGVPADTESETLWREVTDVNPSHISRWGMKDNFWEMADIGPCGLNSEIHIDLTVDGSGAALVNAGDPRVMELWNLVFIQFNRDATGTLRPLSAKHVDTGLGFERIVRVLQGVGSDYDTDLFTSIFTAIREVTGARPYIGSSEDRLDVAYRVIADHVRCLVFALTDGAVPSNEGRGYVLRRILRRAVRHGWQTLQICQPFLHRLVPAVIEATSGAFPELGRNAEHVAEMIRAEEQSFSQTLGRGIALFEQAACKGGGQIGGDDAFKLHDTYGFPLDLTQVMAEERGITVDVEGFDQRMDLARQRARAAGTRHPSDQALFDLVQTESPLPTQFTGYTGTDLDSTSPCLLFSVGDSGYQQCQTATVGDEMILITNRTPFYAEAGGQVADTGTIANASGAVFRVVDVQKVAEVSVHFGVIEAGLFMTVTQATEKLTFRVDPDRRRRIMANHTSTHMLNRALRAHVNLRAEQKGSLVDDEKLRFDFAHGAAMTDDQIENVEQMVNSDIADDLPMHDGCAPLADGQKINGLRAVFGEKYPSSVRIVSIGVPVEHLLAEPDKLDWEDHSIEFCGGTHLARTGDVARFVIVSEEAVAKGVRRITALTGEAAHQASAAAQVLLNRLQTLQQQPGERRSDDVRGLMQAMEQTALPSLAAARLREGLGQLQKSLKDRQKHVSRLAAAHVVAQARTIANQCDRDLIVASIDGANATMLRIAMDVIRKSRPQAAMLLVAAADNKLAFLAAVPQILIDRGLRAGDWVRQVAAVTGGSGGGRADMAQAGGKDAAKLAEALQLAREIAVVVVSSSKSGNS